MVISAPSLLEILMCIYSPQIFLRVLCGERLLKGYFLTPMRRSLARASALMTSL